MRTLCNGLMLKFNYLTPSFMGEIMSRRELLNSKFRHLFTHLYLLTGKKQVDGPRSDFCHDRAH